MSPGLSPAVGCHPRVRVVPSPIPSLLPSTRQVLGLIAVGPVPAGHWS